MKSRLKNNDPYFRQNIKFRQKKSISIFNTILINFVFILINQYYLYESQFNIFYYVKNYSNTNIYMSLTFIYQTISTLTQLVLT